MAISISATSSLTLTTLSPKSFTLVSPKPNAVSFPVRSSLAVALGLRRQPPSRFARNVAVSSEFDQDEEVLGGEEEEEASFSPELKLFVGNLPFNVDSARLAGLFERAGNVEMVEVIYDKATGRSRGFGFVTMSSIGEVEAAAQQFNGYELDGRALRVNYGPPPAREQDSFPRGGRGGGGGYGGGMGGGGGGIGASRGNRVYVGNLPWSADDSVLENLFSEQGNVLEAKVVYDRDSGRSRGFGFVTYDTADEVNNAIESLNGADLDGRQIRVTHAESKPRRSF